MTLTPFQKERLLQNTKKEGYHAVIIDLNKQRQIKTSRYRRLNSDDYADIREIDEKIKFVKNYF